MFSFSFCLIISLLSKIDSLVKDFTNNKYDYHNTWFLIIIFISTVTIWLIQKILNIIKTPIAKSENIFLDNKTFFHKIPRFIVVTIALIPIMPVCLMYLLFKHLIFTNEILYYFLVIISFLAPLVFIIRYFKKNLFFDKELLCKSCLEVEFYPKKTIKIPWNNLEIVGIKREIAMCFMKFLKIKVKNNSLKSIRVPTSMKNFDKFYEIILQNTKNTRN